MLTESTDAGPFEGYPCPVLEAVVPLLESFVISLGGELVRA